MSALRRHDPLGRLAIHAGGPHVLALLVVGGIDLVRQTMDTATVATGINMTFVNGTLPLMAIVVFIIRLRELVATFKRPASSFHAKRKED